MSDREHAPLSIACVRALVDKTYDKRKAASVEIEKMVKEFVANNKSDQIRKLLKVLGSEFAMSQNSNYKRGGFMGLAGAAIALGKDSTEYTEALIHPILTNFNDNNVQTRYYACESLFNVVKVARGAVLPYFADIFTALSKLATENEPSLKSGSEMLDRLMKDIVTENATFDLVGFMPLLRERLYSRNTFARQYIISWVSVLDAVPDIQLILFLPEMLDGLFLMLGDPQVKNMCDSVLKEFLRSINKDPTQVDFSEMINVLITHSQASDETLQITALRWIVDFLRLSGDKMVFHTAGILTAILPCLAYEGENKKNVKETAKLINVTLMELISSELDCPSNKTEETNGVDLSVLLDVLTKHLLHTSVQTKVASLKWIHHLHTKMPNRMSTEVDVIFPTLLQALSDVSDDVVQHVLNVLAQIISPQSERIEGKSQYFGTFLISLLKQFREERPLLEERGAFIIRQLCTHLNAEQVYKNTAINLTREEDLKFTRVMVDTLNTILLTSSELYKLRNKLKNEKAEELFECLYHTWCHNPVATISLCLLSQNYAHVCDLINTLANYEITVEFLVEIDRLIQLIESPIFNYLRLELLQIPHNYFLIRSMYGLLMILPQSETFHLLRHRLECIPKLTFFHESSKQKDVPQNKGNGNKYNLDFTKLLNHFISVQDMHKIQRV